MADHRSPAAPVAGNVPAFVRRGVAHPEPGSTTSPRAHPGSADGPGPSRPPDAGRSPSARPRRRLVVIAGALVVAWVVIAFGRQVGDAAAASDRAAQLRQANAQLTAELAALQADLDRVQDEPYVNVAARGFDVGARHEVPFALAPGAPSLPPDAPGSAAVRVGAPPPTSPLEAWLSLLFGSGG